jgi:hypothetical protein
MQVFFKYLAQFLLLPLLKDLIAQMIKHFKDKAELKRLKEENKKKGEAYENAPSETAHNDFARLP